MNGSLTTGGGGGRDQTNVMIIVEKLKLSKMWAPCRATERTSEGEAQEEADVGRAVCKNTTVSAGQIGHVDL